MDVPKDVVEWIRAVFLAGNERISEKLSNNPNLPEESLDLTWIEHLSHHSAPVTLASDWTVQVETHFLGGRRHWGSWEIGDIGLLFFAEFSREERVNKVAILQSKRLYPTSGAVEEETQSDYLLGFGRLADPEVLARPISLDRKFEFIPSCTYGALRAGSKQVRAIDDYEENVGLRVYYQFYNPWTVPFTQHLPLHGRQPPGTALSHGVRVIPASLVHQLLQSKAERYSPALSDLADVGGLDDDLGWRLETFVADEWIGCREGDTFDSPTDFPIESLFFRRTGPISAAISIRAQSPEAAG